MRKEFKLYMRKVAMDHLDINTNGILMKRKKIFFAHILQQSAQKCFISWLKKAKVPKVLSL